MEVSDFIIFVRRTPSYMEVTSRHVQWRLQRLDPCSRTVCLPYSIASRCRGFHRTIVSLTNRSVWFHVPMESQLDCNVIFWLAFEEEFRASGIKCPIARPPAALQEEEETSMMAASPMFLLTETTRKPMETNHKMLIKHIVVRFDGTSKEHRTHCLQ